MTEYIVPLTSLASLNNAVELWSKKLNVQAVLQTVGGVLSQSAKVRLVGDAGPELIEICRLAQEGQRLPLPEPDIHVANELSEFVGEQGQKLEIDVELYHVIDFNGDFGLSFIHKMRDEAGNEIVWFSSRERYRAGRKYKLAGRVKEHVVYADNYTGKDIKQTKVIRCKLTELKPKAIAKTVTSDWCDLCEAPQMVLPNGEHLCAEEEDNDAPF